MSAYGRLGGCHGSVCASEVHAIGECVSHLLCPSPTVVFGEWHVDRNIQGCVPVSVDIARSHGLYARGFVVQAFHGHSIASDGRREAGVEHCLAVFFTVGKRERVG